MVEKTLTNKQTNKHVVPNDWAMLPGITPVGKTKPKSKLNKPRISMI